MPFKDPAKRAHVQRHKWDLWREMQDGFADEETCRHCGLPIFCLRESRWSADTDFWLHFSDPKGHGIRPLGKNDPVYDLVRTCATALRHRYVPEVYETHDGRFEGLDPRAGAYRDLKTLTEERLIERLPPRCVAEP